MKRNVIIIGIVILLVLLAVGLYFLLFAPKPTASTGTPNAGSLPSTGNQTVSTSSGIVSGTGTATSTPTVAQSLSLVANGPILDYFVSNADVVTAIKEDGTIIQMANNQSSTLSSLPVQEISSASFSYDGKKILVNFGSAADPQTSIFDIATKAWTPLNSGLQSPVWSPSDYRIAYVSTGSNGVEIFSIIDASKAKPTPTTVDRLYAQDLAVAWPMKNELLLYTKPSAFVPGSALAFDLQKKTLTTIASNEDGLIMAWDTSTSTASSSAGILFASGAFGLGGSLQLINWSGVATQNLSFTTLPSKCAFATTSSTPYLFCGVPRNQTQISSAHLPDDYDKMAFFTSDDLYRVNLESGAIDTIFTAANQNFDVSDVKFFGNTLYFVNRYDQKLYSIQLLAGA